MTQLHPTTHKLGQPPHTNWASRACTWLTLWMHDTLLPQGPLVFEARRFVELRKKSFKEQFFSSESFGMGVFYTLNVFFMQFYLGESG